MTKITFFGGWVLSGRNGKRKFLSVINERANKIELQNHEQLNFHPSGGDRRKWERCCRFFCPSLRYCRPRSTWPYPENLLAHSPQICLVLRQDEKIYFASFTCRNTIVSSGGFVQTHSTRMKKRKRTSEKGWSIEDQSYHCPNGKGRLSVGDGRECRRRLVLWFGSASLGLVNLVMDDLINDRTRRVLRRGK